MKVSAVFSLLFVVAAKDLSQGTQSIAEMGSAQLLEMKEELSSRIASGEEANEDEKKTLRYFKQMIINTSLANINETVAAARAAIALEWGHVTNCESTLESVREGPKPDTWTALKATVTANYAALQDCYPTKPATCENCAKYIKSLTPPETTQPQIGKSSLVHFWNKDKSDEENEDINSKIGQFTSLHGDFLTWYSEYENWHCTNTTCEVVEPPQEMTPYQCVKACSDECSNDLSNYHNAMDYCKKAQTAFEKSVCILHGSIGSSCVAYFSCRYTHDAAYLEVLDDEKKQDALRKLEYRIMMTIICYIDLMVENKSIKKEQKEACEKDWDTNFLNLAAPHVKVPQWKQATTLFDGHADCSCETLPSSQLCVSFDHWPSPLTGRTQHAAWDGVYPFPCEKEFWGKWGGDVNEYDMELCYANGCDKSWLVDMGVW